MEGTQRPHAPKRRHRRLCALGAGPAWLRRQRPHAGSPVPPALGRGLADSSTSSRPRQGGKVSTRLLFLPAEAPCLRPSMWHGTGSVSLGPEHVKGVLAPGPCASTAHETLGIEATLPGPPPTSAPVPAPEPGPESAEVLAARCPAVCRW